MDEAKSSFFMTKATFMNVSNVKQNMFHRNFVAQSKVKARQNVSPSYPESKLSKKRTRETWTRYLSMMRFDSTALVKWLSRVLGHIKCELHEEKC